jgi:hypothetical protein
MIRSFTPHLAVLVLAGITRAHAPISRADGRTLHAAELAKLSAENGEVTRATFRGRDAVHLTPRGAAMPERSMWLVTRDFSFTDGTIDALIAGSPRPDAPPDARGFIGVAFRVDRDAGRSEMFYVRPTNARADDQLRRNHTVQYVAEPDWPWQRLRAESPGEYESYADMQPGEWVHVRIVVAGTTARFYVGDATEPCLVVSDLKNGRSSGQIALWALTTTDAYFASLAVR